MNWILCGVLCGLAGGLAWIGLELRAIRKSLQARREKNLDGVEIIKPTLANLDQSIRNYP